MYRAKKAVSMVEIIMTLLVIAGIVTVVARGFGAVAKSSTLQNTGTILSSAQVAIRTDSENTATMLLPDFTKASLQIGTLTQGNSLSSKDISYNRISGTKYTLAARYAGGCLILVDSLTSKEGWLVIENPDVDCKAPGEEIITGVTLGPTPREANQI